MKNLSLCFITLIIILALTNCGMNSQESFQGRRIGSWYQSSPTKANYVGLGTPNPLATGTADSGAVIDSTIRVTYNAPDHNSLTLTNLNDYIGLTYVDSTLNFDAFDSLSVWTDDNINAIEQGSRYFNVSAPVVQHFNCDSTYNPQKFVEIYYFPKGNYQDTLKIIRFNVQGMTQTIKSITCN